MDKNVSGLVKSMNNITNSFNSLKFLVVFCVVGSFLTSIGCLVYSKIERDEILSKVYVLDNGTAFSASSKDASITKSDEIINQINIFHSLFFNIPPDMSMIKRNLEKALAMSDKSVYDYYVNLMENGFYSKMVKADAYQQVDVQKVDVDVSVYPYTVVTKCIQWITRNSNITKYSLVTRCVVVNIPRSPGNQHGLLIQKFEVIENAQLETRKR